MNLLVGLVIFAPLMHVLRFAGEEKSLLERYKDIRPDQWPTLKENPSFLIVI